MWPPIHGILGLTSTSLVCALCACGTGNVTTGTTESDGQGDAQSDSDSKQDGTGDSDTPSAMDGSDEESGTTDGVSGDGDGDGDASDEAEDDTTGSTDDDSTTSAESDSSDDDGSSDSDQTDDACDELPELPASYQTIKGLRSSEDFAFTADGVMISASMGNLYKSTRDAQPKTWVPGAVGEKTAGTRLLPDGTLVIADVTQGSLLGFDSDGVRRVILTGLEYPNGLAVDRKGTIYVAEHAAGRVRRVDAQTGDFEIIGMNFVHPNGLALTPDERTLYVGSFGDGTVHAIDFDDQGKPTTRLFADRVGWPATVPSDVGDAEWSACEGKLELAPCSTGNASFGHCVTAAGSEPFCFLEWRNYPEGKVPRDRFSACDGLKAGDACNTVLWEDDVTGVCMAAFASKVMCWPDNIQGLGDLDGVGVDACGNVYVTQYVAGMVWRIDQDGKQDIVADLGEHTDWIPNMNWGRGVGGFEPDKLYVISRMGDVMYEINIGIGPAR